jgi:hypothetical protein
MAVLYVDECGEEGFSASSSQWLIVGGVLQRDNVVLSQTKEAYDAFKAKYRQENWHFHFQKASHSTRLGFIHTMRDTGMRAIAVAIYKPAIRQPDNFRKKYYLYFYALRFLLEKATIWCREYGAIDEMHVYLSTRRGLAIENLNQYLEKSSQARSQKPTAWNGATSVTREYSSSQMRNFAASKWPTWSQVR